MSAQAQGDDAFDEPSPPATQTTAATAANGEVGSASTDEDGRPSAAAMEAEDPSHGAGGGGGLGANDAPAPPPKVSSPEPPRWRFVKTAKKTLGYSSIAAGTVVQGLSAEELASKFHAPQWKAAAESAAEDVDEQAAVESHEEETEQQKTERSVGRLDVREGGEDVEETFVGTFPGFRRTAEEAEDEGPEETRASDRPFSPEPEMEVANLAPPDVLDELDRAEKQIMKTGGPPTPTSTSAGPTPPASPQSSDEELGQGLDEPPEEVAERGSKKKWAVLLVVVLLLVVSVALLVAALNDRSPEEEGGADREISSSQKILPSETIHGASNAPTSAPTYNATSGRANFAVWVG